MKTQQRQNWAFYGGLCGIVALTLLFFVYYAVAGYFHPNVFSRPFSVSGIPLMLAFTVPCGLLFGGFIGYELAPKSKQERMEEFYKYLFYAAFMLISDVFLRFFWDKDKVTENRFVEAVWSLGPLILAVSLWNGIERWKNRRQAKK